MRLLKEHKLFFFSLFQVEQEELEEQVELEELAAQEAWVVLVSIQ